MFDNKYFDGSGSGGGSLAPGVTPVVGGTEHAILYIDSALMQGSANFTYDGSNVTLTDGWFRSARTYDDYTYGNQILYGFNSSSTIANLTEGYGAITHYGMNVSMTVSATNMKRQQTLYGSKTTISCYDGMVDETVYAYGWFRISGTANVLAGETVTVGTVTYTFVAALAAEGDILIGSTQFESLSRLAAAINGTGTYGVDHQVTAANADATCTGVYSTTVNLKAVAIGVAGESVALAETSGRLTRSAATLLRKSASSYTGVYGQDVSIDVQKASLTGAIGYRAIINVGTSTADQTCNVIRGIETQVAVNAVDATIARGTMHGAYFGAYVNGGLMTNVYGLEIDMTLQNDGATSFSAVNTSIFGIKVNIAGSCLPGTVAGDACALYLPDFSIFMATRTYGIMQLGVGLNYFEGVTQFLQLQTGGVVTAATGTGQLGLVTDAAGYLMSDGSGNLSFAAVVPGPGGADTEVQFNNAAALDGDPEFTYTVGTGVVTIGQGTNPAALLIQGPGRASDGRTLRIDNTGAAGVVALEINSHAGGTTGYGINMSAIIPINIVTVGSNYALTAINHVNVADSGGVSLTIGAGDQASSKDIAYLRRIGAGAHTGNAITILRDNSTAGAGTSPGVDADTLGTIAFKGYNDRAAGSGGPELTTFNYATSSIRDASDTTEGGALTFGGMANGVSMDFLKLNTQSPVGWAACHDFVSSAGSTLGTIVRIYSLANSGAQLYVDGNGGDGQIILSAALTGKWGFAHSVANSGFYMYSYQSGYYPLSIVVESPTKENLVFGGGSATAIPATANQNIFFKNVGVAPSAAPVDLASIWCADYAAGDARLYLMGEKNTNKLAFGAGSVLLDSNLADDSESGITFVGTAGENLVRGNVCYRKSDGKYWKADADAATTMPGVAIALGSITADTTGEFLSYGFFRDDSAFNFTVGVAIYVDTTTAGLVTATAPTGVGDQVQVLGYAYSADVIFFNPQLVMVEV